MADGSKTIVRYVAESTWGTTPASPVFKALRVTDSDLRSTVQLAKSNEIGNNRRVLNGRKVGDGATLSLPFEFSYGTFDDFLEALLGGTWTTNVLKDGATLKSFTVEEEQPDLSPALFRSAVGMRVGAMDCSIQPGQIITGTWNLTGKAVSAPATTSLASSTTAAPTGDPLNAVSDVSALQVDGTAMGLAQLDLSFDNGIRVDNAIGVLGAQSIGFSDMAHGGSIRAYVANKALLDLFHGDDYTTLSFTLSDPDGNSYAFDYPRIKFNDAQAPSGGRSSSRVQTLPFDAYYDATAGYTVQITRTPAV